MIRLIDARELIDKFRDLDEIKRKSGRPRTFTLDEIVERIHLEHEVRTFEEIFQAGYNDGFTDGEYESTIGPLDPIE